MLKSLILACAIISAIRACGVPAIEPQFPEASQNIVGGHEAEKNSWPWMVEIMGETYYCGGTLIDEEWIVSAAHCFERNPDVSKYQFTLGGHVFRKDSEFTRQTFQATKIIRHEDYSAISNANDIALIKISGLVENDYVSPACTASSRPADGTDAVVTGWGDQEEPYFIYELQQVTVPIVNQDVCNKAYRLFGGIDSSMICAGFENGGKDSCQGDSGGPLVVKIGGRWTLVGVVSWGVGCADPGKYGVYADVSYLSGWIQRTMLWN